MSSIQHLACPLGGVAAAHDSCGWSCMATSSGNCWKHCGRDSKAKSVNAKLPHWKKNSESNTIKALLHQVRLIIVPSAEPMSPLEHFDGTSSKRKGFASPSCQLESTHHGLPNMRMDRHCEHWIPNHIPYRKLSPFTLANLPRAWARNAKLAGGRPYGALAEPLVSKAWAAGLRASIAKESPWQRRWTSTAANDVAFSPSAWSQKLALEACCLLALDQS